MDAFSKELQNQILERFGIEDHTNHKPYHKEFMRLQALLENSRQTAHARQQKIEKQVVRWE